MAPDPLQTLLRLRRMEVDAARAELVRRETSEHEADIRTREAKAAIQAEFEAASRLTADDAAVEAFGAWLPKARQTAALAKTTLERAQQDAAQARTRLNLARAAVEACEKLMEKRHREAEQQTLRKLQNELDEASAQSRRRLPE